MQFNVVPGHCWWYSRVVDRAHHRRLPVAAYPQRTDGCGHNINRWCYDDRRLMQHFPCMWWIPRVLDNCPVACRRHSEFLNFFRFPWMSVTGPGGRTETIVNLLSRTDSRISWSTLDQFLTLSSTSAVTCRRQRLVKDCCVRRRWPFPSNGNDGRLIDAWGAVCDHRRAS